MIFMMENLRDPQGPDHKPRILPCKAIEGVFTQHSPQVKSLNTEDNFLTDLGTAFFINHYPIYNKAKLENF